MRLVWRRDWSTVGVILLAILYFAVLIGPLSSTRYRVVMRPALYCCRRDRVEWERGGRETMSRIRRRIRFGVPVPKTWVQSLDSGEPHCFLRHFHSKIRLDSQCLQFR